MQTDKIKALTIGCIGFTPTFINADLGKFTGTIIIVNNWPLPPAERERQGLPPATDTPTNVWNGISKLDIELGNLLQEDITKLHVSFTTENYNYRFRISFDHE